MNKTLSSVISVSILLAACSAPPVQPTQPSSVVCVCECEVSCPQETPEPTPVTAEPTIVRGRWTYQDMVVGFLQTGSEGGWRAANTASFKETAEELGITLKFYDATGKISNQYAAFRRFTADEDVFNSDMPNLQEIADGRKY